MILAIEGTDCSGKETQSKLLEEKLKQEGLSTKRLSFPVYDSPTGKIVGGPYLGKKEISSSYFSEGAVNLNPKISSLYFAADRSYNVSKITEANVDVVILDRYIFSNMAHQGSKIKDQKERFEFYKWLEELEFNLLELPKVDLVIFLHMPYEKACLLKANRNSIDEHEKDPQHLKDAERTYLELANLYQWETISCVENNNLKTKEEIAAKVYKIVKPKL